MATAILLAMALMTAPTSIFAAAQAPGPGTINGRATDESGQPLPNMLAQLRNIATKQIVGATTTNAQGLFSFVGLNPGQYVVEITALNGAIVGTTVPITLAAGAMAATGVTVVVTAAGAIAGGAAAAGGIGSFFTTTAGFITAVAIVGETTAAIIALNDQASPSR